MSDSSFDSNTDMSSQIGEGDDSSCNLDSSKEESGSFEKDSNVNILVRVLQSKAVHYCLLFICGFFFALFLVAGFLLIFFKYSQNDNVSTNIQRNKQVNYVGWSKNGSAGVFRSSKSIQDLEFSLPNGDVHFFSMDDHEDQELFKVEVRVGEVDYLELKKLLFKKDNSDPTFQCYGSCFCGEEGESLKRRQISQTARAIKGIPYIIVAASSAIAYNLAKQHFSQECQEELQDICESGQNAIISSVVEDCDDYNGVEVDILDPTEAGKLAFYNCFVAYVISHDVLKFEIWAKDEAEAETFAIDKTVEHFKEFAVDFEDVAMEGIYIDAFQFLLLYKLFTYKVDSRRFPLKPDNVLCCSKCRGTIPFRKTVCCVVNLKFDQTYQSGQIQYADDLVGYAQFTLNKLCCEKKGKQYSELSSREIVKPWCRVADGTKYLKSKQMWFGMSQSEVTCRPPAT